MKFVKIIVSGKVQGVFFRDFIQKKALNYNIKGYVKNLDDGSVEIVAQGDKKNISNFIFDCKIGTPLAKVKNLDIEEIQLSKKFNNFKILF